MDFTDFKPSPDLSRASTLPSRWYIDPQFLEVEKEKIFWKTWQAVGRLDSVLNPGDYFTCEVLGEPIVVVRGKDHTLRAFSNVCRHRAGPVALGKGNRTSLQCRYHGWTYDLDGRLIGAPEFEGVEDWEKTQVSLPRVKVESWGPFIFVNVDQDAPSLGEVLGKIPEEVSGGGFQLEGMQFLERRDYVIDCNWKVYVDNYLEGYHLPIAHPALFREVDYSGYRVDTFRYYSSAFAPMREKGSNDRKALYYWVFPNFMISIYPDNLHTSIILPVGHDKVLTIFEWYFAESAAAKGEEAVRQAIAFNDQTQREDIEICEAVWRGLQSRTYSQGRLSVKRENGVYHFHQLLHEFLTTG